MRKYVGEPLLNPPVSYPHMKTNLFIELIGLRHQPDHRTAKKTQLVQENGTDPDKSKFFLILVRRREKELIRDGDKIIEGKVI